MRAHTTHNTTTGSRPRRKARHVALALAFAVCALAIPAGAAAQSNDSDYSSVNAITGGSSGSSGSVALHRDGSKADPTFADVDPGHSSLNAITGPSSEPSGSGGLAEVDSGYSSLNAITGPVDEPTFVSGLPADTADGFDWASAGIGAGAAMALVALGGAAFLTVRRRTAVSPSAASTS